MEIKIVMEEYVRGLKEEGEFWVVNYFKEDIGGSRIGVDWVSDWDIKNRGVITAGIDRGEFKGKLCEGNFYGGGYSESGLYLVGSGEDFDVEGLKSICAKGVREGKRRGYRKVGFYMRGLEGLGLDMGMVVSLMVEGAYVGDYDFSMYKTLVEVEGEVKGCEELKICLAGYEGEEGVLDGGVSEGRSIGLGMCFAKDMVNRPGNECTPVVLVEEALRYLEGKGGGCLEVEVLEEEEVRGLGMGLLLGVSRGSDEPLKLLVMHYKPKDVKSEEKLGLVGKGITFDTGGISLKPSNKMYEMKGDMAGGAAVIGTMGVISELDLGVEVIGVVPMTENMPSGKALKPGDVIQSMSGKSVEILDTDAEGRLILADALTYVMQKGATRIIDVATLTGACVVALGEYTTGLFGNDSSFIKEFMKVSGYSGEKVWQLPLFKKYAEQLKSDLADLSNIGNRYAGAITAASFLESFVDKVPWLHLDIAGTSWNSREGGYNSSKGGTGVMISTFTKYIKYLEYLN